MNLRFRISIALAALLVGAAIVVHASNDNADLRSVLGEDLYSECGLAKLNAAEQQQLLGFVIRQAPLSFLEESAVRFLEQEGWEPVTVLGLVRSPEAGGEYRVLARHHGVLYTLRPSIIPHLPDPGVYWADFVGSHWSILYPNGEDGSFSATELK